MFDPNERDRASRELWHWDDEEQAKKPAKAFQHREMVSRCPTCRLRIRLRGQFVCRASGARIVEESGAASCAFEPIKEEGGS